MLVEKKHNSTLDRQGRFLMPTSVLRDWNVKMEDGFMLNRSSDKCLTLYPMRIWKEYRAELDKLNALDPKVRQLIRYFTGGATDVKPDAKNRLLIPKHLQEYAKLDKELYVTKINFLVEIWNPTLYEECNNNFVENNKEFITEISNKIFGDGTAFKLS
jgi:MraZ protein